MIVSMVVAGMAVAAAIGAMFGYLVGYRNGRADVIEANVSTRVIADADRIIGGRP